LDPSILTRYADIVLSSGVNLAEGQPVLIRGDVACRDFAQVLARRAYELGACFVHTVYSDQKLDIARLQASREEHLPYTPSWIRPNYRTYVEENWASISISGSEDPDAYEGADARRLGTMRKAMSIAAEEWLASVSSNAIRWNVVLYPTPMWAKKVLGDAGGWEERIWDVLLPILRLDTPDPATAWLAHDAELKRRAGFLNSRRFDAFRFEGPGTDLTIGMAPDRVFCGGRCVAKDGRPFFPNIPTEEVFSTPDFRRTEGRVSCTRPVQVLGSNVEGAWFRFEGGKVVEFGADRNSSVLGQYLATDERAGSIGEIALVGAESPIFGSGLIFHNILLDENASCHIALGNGYTECLEGVESHEKDVLLAGGCNVSLVHTDFMIGSSEVSVYGIDKSGRRSELLRNGLFVI
jgi:aminopeptidase